MPIIDGHSAYEEASPSLSKNGKFLISGNKTAAAWAHILVSAHENGRVGPHIQHRHQIRKLKIPPTRPADQRMKNS